ncbi:hypothetical protein ACFQX6_03305 [Streptosporangium lutulentum]
MSAVIETGALRAPARPRRSTTLVIGCVLVGAIVAVAVVSLLGSVRPGRHLG